MIGLAWAVTGHSRPTRVGQTQSRTANSTCNYYSLGRPGQSEPQFRKDVPCTSLRSPIGPIGLGWPAQGWVWILRACSACSARHRCNSVRAVAPSVVSDVSMGSECRGLIRVLVAVNLCRATYNMDPYNIQDKELWHIDLLHTGFCFPGFIPILWASTPQWMWL